MFNFNNLLFTAKWDTRRVRNVYQKMKIEVEKICVKIERGFQIIRLEKKVGSKEVWGYNLHTQIILKSAPFNSRNELLLSEGNLCHTHTAYCKRDLFTPYLRKGDSGKQYSNDECVCVPLASLIHSCSRKYICAG